MQLFPDISRPTYYTFSVVPLRTRTNEVRTSFIVLRINIACDAAPPCGVVMAIRDCFFRYHDDL